MNQCRVKSGKVRSAYSYVENVRSRAKPYRHKSGGQANNQYHPTTFVGAGK